MGPAAVTAPLQDLRASSVLQDELAIRAMDGVGFMPGRTAVINSSGSGLTGQRQKSRADCVQVDRRGSVRQWRGGWKSSPTIPTKRRHLGLVMDSN